jgi:chloramphenicol-sensitive protein RarD
MNNAGVLSAIVAYTLWGLLPIYWKSIHTVPAFEVLCHRTVWSLTFVLLLLLWKKHWSWLDQARKSRATIITFLVTSSILGINWFVYIWAVNAGHILDASLGYFINPLISVLLGMLFLGERLRPWQWVAIGIALCGVVFLTVGYGAFPWIALTLALTFGFYGLLRKTASLEALEGLALETAVLSVPALAYLVYLELTGTASFGHAGIVTALPLLLFASAARKVTLATVGILQYIAPTMQFLLGALVYGETFTETRLIGFGTVWIALIVYSLEGIIERRRRKMTALPVG